MTEIMIPIGIVSVMGLIAGVILSLATIIFHKPVDEKEEALRGALPGINCGACGFSGCDGYAKAMAEGNAGATNCTPGGASTRQALSEILGVEVDDVQKSRHLSDVMEPVSLQIAKWIILGRLLAMERIKFLADRRIVDLGVWDLVTARQFANTMRFILLMGLQR